ncbi:hypothetical protein FDECE_14237 [Fusarium decemcellulare]|nr:hypothetical protein FDECE_14237 [Fusarium decemcellulare]
MLVFRLAIALLVLGTSALGGDAGSLPPTITCVKQLGPVKVRKPIPKSTSTVTKNVVIIKNIIRKVNITIIPIAQTVTETATNQETTTKIAGAGTKTATDTVTSPVTVTSTTELTEVEIKTETITTTKTIPAVVAAPAGFTPIRKAPGYVAKLKARELKERVERDNEDDSEDEDGVLLPADGPKPGKSIRQYVQRVDCVKTVTSASVETFKTIIQGPKITLEPRTKTKTATVTETVTETEFPPDVTDTVTETATPTEAEWKTIMKTNTVTETGKYRSFATNQDVLL